MRATITLRALFVVATLAATALAQLEIEFRRVAGEGDPLPGGQTWAFELHPYNAPAIDPAGNLAFSPYTDPNFLGLFSERDGDLVETGATHTPYPGGGNLRYIRDLVLDNDIASWIDVSGIYQTAADGSGALSSIVTIGDPVPDNAGLPRAGLTFRFFNQHMRSGDVTVFSAQTDLGFDQTEVFVADATGVRRLLGRGMPSPLGDGGQIAAAGHVHLQGGNWAGEVTSTNGDIGVVGDFGSGVVLIATTGTPYPDGSDNMLNARRPLVDGNRVVFTARAPRLVPPGTGSGVIEWDAATGALRTIIDFKTPPTPNNGFSATGAADGGTVMVQLDPPYGTYVARGDTLTKILDGDGQLGNANVASVRSGPESLSGNRLAFTTRFENGHDSYWVATLTCPGDTNGDETVDLTDLATVLSQFGQTAADLAGDLNEDGAVDLDDLSKLLANFGLDC